jgi:hypothetical protein
MHFSRVARPAVGGSPSGFSSSCSSRRSYSFSFYIADEGFKLAQRFVNDREGMGRDITSILSSHRLGAMGTSERGVAATYHSEERQECMQKLLDALKRHDGRRYNKA